MLGYLALAWLVLQLTDVLSGIWDWSIRLQRVITVVLGLGVLPALVVAWYHGERGRQDLCKAEALILATVLACSSPLVWSYLRASSSG